MKLELKSPLVEAVREAVEKNMTSQVQDCLVDVASQTGRECVAEMFAVGVGKFAGEFVSSLLKQLLGVRDKLGQLQREVAKANRRIQTLELVPFVTAIREWQRLRDVKGTGSEQSPLIFDRAMFILNCLAQYQSVIEMDPSANDDFPELQFSVTGGLLSSICELEFLSGLVVAEICDDPANAAMYFNNCTPEIRERLKEKSQSIARQAEVVGRLEPQKKDLEVRPHDIYSTPKVIRSISPRFGLPDGHVEYSDTQSIERRVRRPTEPTLKALETAQNELEGLRECSNALNVLAMMIQSFSSPASSK